MSFIKEVDDIFNSKLDKACYSNFNEVYGHLLYDSAGRIKKLLRDIDKTLLYTDMQLRLSFDSDLCDISLFKKLILIQHNVITQPICQCGNIIKYTNSRDGLYNIECSYSCRTSSSMLKRCQTNLGRYGVGNPFQCDKIKDKIKQTNLKRYDVENVHQCKEIQDKVKQTNLDRYGFENPLQSKEIREKVKQTNLKRYGVEHIWQNVEIQEKIKQTNLERHGFEYPIQRNEIQEKIKQTNLERLGVESPLQSKQIQEKIKQTNLKRYSFENPAQCNEVQEKMRITYLENNLDSIWENILSNTHCRPLFSKDEYINASQTTIYNWECTNCNLRYESYYYSGKVKACPICTKSRSLGEIELYNYIQSLIPDVEVIANDYNVIPPKEIDIYIPSLKLAFEYNGDYWHSLKEDGYHEGKTSGCEAKDIRLYHILESDWKLRTDEIKLFILDLIGIK